MKILILNNSPHENNPYEEWLSDISDELIILTSDQYEKDFDHYLYKESFPHYETNSLVELRAIELYEKYQYEQVIALNEWDVLRAGQLRERLGLKGQRYESAVVFRNKEIMKKYARKSGVFIPKYKVINHAFDVLDFLDEAGYPIVVKPIAGAGSRNTVKIDNHDDLERFLNESLYFPLLAEEFIDGDMYHIDGLVLNGEIVFVWPSKYINGCLAYQDSKYLGSYLLDPDNPMTARLQEAVRELIRQFPTPEHTTFHAELFHTADDQLYFCEVASRTGGVKVNDSIQHAFGINISKIWARSLCGRLPDLQDFRQLSKKRTSGFVLIPPKKGTLVQMNTSAPFDWVIKQEYHAQVGETFSGAKRSVDCVALFVVDGKSEHEVVQRINEVARWFESQTVYK
ncbi:ATP-grasp domain-containing protein [Thermoflavimicrobium dichotomicum]|uniref:ATP-grasp domain-containing protein n=1 Tax=Thermoflavimicrobium dichotomicum TaxID=46223 RepID=A0A1I3QID5_9BACL|nr:ATP-grasp domain-containing protein [Thermoflavimicrobium dichotomicum]SFJ32946.1 ATP-grasp domain-containing protein [Thermoflavimicrobium dichotomicum]